MCQQCWDFWVFAQPTNLEQHVDALGKLPSGNLSQKSIEHGPFMADLPIQSGDFP